MLYFVCSSGRGSNSACSSQTSGRDPLLRASRRYCVLTLRAVVCSVSCGCSNLLCAWCELRQNAESCSRLFYAQTFWFVAGAGVPHTPTPRLRYVCDGERHEPASHNSQTVARLDDLWCDARSTSGTARMTLFAGRREQAACRS